MMKFFQSGIFPWCYRRQLFISLKMDGVKLLNTSYWVLPRPFILTNIFINLSTVFIFIPNSAYREHKILLLI